MIARDKRRPAPKARPVPGVRPTCPNVEIVKPVPESIVDETPAFCPAALEFESVASTAMFNTLGSVRAVGVRDAPSAMARRSIAETRGYSDTELFAFAEIGYHYFRNGGLRLALVIFEGLAAVKPTEPYYFLATGVARDYLGDKIGAKQAYREAMRLDAGDARPELNLAELALEAGDRRTAMTHLLRAELKADARGDQPLSKKAKAVLSLVRKDPRSTP